MSGVPRHPDTNPDTNEISGRQRLPWWMYVVGTAVVALIVTMAVLHLSGAVGPGAH